MRVNMDSSIVFDPRFKMLSKALGISFREVVGSCFLLWLHCYQNRSSRLTFAEADAMAETEGFGTALVAVGLADGIAGDQKCLTVHGVTKRIKFLNVQQSNGSKGGRASAKSRREKKLQYEANAKQTLEHSSSVCQATVKQPSSPSPTPSLAPSPTLPPIPTHTHENNTAASPSAVRRDRDPLWDAIVTVTGVDASIKSKASHIGKVRKALSEAVPPYGAADVLALPGVMATQTPWAAGRVITLGEVESNIHLVRNKAAPVPSKGNGNDLRQRIIENGNEFIRLTGGAGAQHDKH